MPSTPCPPPPPTPSKPSLPDAVSLNDGSFAFPCSSFLGLRPTKPSPNFHFSHPQNRRSPAKHWRSSPQLPSTKKISVSVQADPRSDEPSSCQTRQPTPISGFRPTKPSPDFHFSHPQNRRSPAEHWRSSPQLPSTKKISVSVQADPRNDEPSSCQTRQPAPVSGLRPTKPSPDFHFSYLQDRRSPAKHWRSSPERRRKKSLRIPAESGRLCAAPTADLRSAQTARLSQTALCRTNPNKPERSEHPILGQTLAITLRPTASGVFP